MYVGAFLTVFLTDTLTVFLAFYLAPILTYFLAYMLTFFLDLSGIYSDIFLLTWVCRFYQSCFLLLPPSFFPFSSGGL